MITWHRHLQGHLIPVLGSAKTSQPGPYRPYAEVCPWCLWSIDIGAICLCICLCNLGIGLYMPICIYMLPSSSRISSICRLLLHTKAPAPGYMDGDACNTREGVAICCSLGDLSKVGGLNEA